MVRNAAGEGSPAVERALLGISGKDAPQDDRGEDTLDGIVLQPCFVTAGLGFPVQEMIVVRVSIEN